MSISQLTHTLSAGSVNMILFAARQRGANDQLLIQAAGIDPVILQNPDGRVGIPQVQILWREAVRATHEPHLALQLGEIINPVSVGVLAYVMMHCPTLGRAFEKLCQYQDIVCNAAKTTGQLTGNQFRISLTLLSEDIIFPEYVFNSELSVYQSAIRAMTGLHITAQEVHFAYPRPADINEHERVFGPAQLRFDAPVTSFVLDAALLDTPILNANPGLFSLFEQHADELLRQLNRATTMPAQVGATARVKAEIVTLLKGEEPTLPVVADRLAMGVRTLQLHLKEEQVTYRQLLDEVRRDLAKKHLREAHLSTTDIAYLLGYAEPSVFFRSFKKWTGATPGAFRASAAA